MELTSSARSEKNIRLGVALAFVVVALVALITWRCISFLVRDARSVEHTVLVLNGVDNLDGQVIRETEAQRLYQLSGEDAFLVRSQTLAGQIPDSLASLRQLTADNPRQQQNLQALTALLQQRESGLAFRPGSRSASAQARGLAAVAGQARFAAIEARLNAMRAEEHRLLTERRHAEKTTIELTYALLAVLGVLLAAILAGTYFVGSRAIQARTLALRTSAQLNAELEGANAALEKQRSQADHANKLKSQFLASMSHELRTPLNAITGFSELLADQVAGQLNEKQQRFLTHIRDASKHLLQLINDVLDLSKIEAGEIHLEPTLLSPAAVIGEVIAGVESLVRQRSIELRADCDPALLVRADPRRLKQILYNLLSNAIKFTPFQGSIIVTVACDDGFLRFEVTDTGPGISKEDQQIIFEEFRQAAPSASGVKEGTGLGLAITRKLVEKHGGHIEVESERGAGSTFRFWLPTSDATPAAPPPASRAARAPRTSRQDQAPLVLVVDDDPGARELIRNVLEDGGYRVAVAASGSEALSATHELRPDLITLDLLMPGGHGFGALYELKSGFRDALPPVIVISVTDDRATGFALGAADYLVKPVSKADLLRAVRRHLPSGNASVLVIDDDPSLLDLAKEVFSQPWITVHLAASGREGLAIAESHPVHAIVLDLLMPEMSGFEVLARLRQDPRLARIPVSILTNQDLSSQEMRELRSKVDAVFHKNEDWRSRLVLQIERSLATHPPDATQEVREA
ncbi:MAG TPA: response regulator [Acidobacteriaceae bacterium]|nr:response regulator [Acidobacteriaceae bacterium]